MTSLIIVYARHKLSSATSASVACAWNTTAAHKFVLIKTCNTSPPSWLLEPTVEIMTELAVIMIHNFIIIIIIIIM